MKKILLIGFLSFISLLSAFSQDLDELTRLSLNYLEQNKIQKFEETYPKLYVEFVKENHPCYKDAIIAVKKGDIELAFSNINDLLDEDLFLDEISNDENFKVLHNKEKWKVLQQKILSITGRYDEKLRLQLKELQDRDQGIRILYMSIENDSLKNVVHNYMKAVDYDCAAKICNILDNYGWLGREKLGDEGNQALFLGIQHVDDLTVQEKYLPMLQEAVKEGRAEGWHLAFLTDRILMNRCEKQIYGTQKIISKDPGQSYIVPLEDPEKVDELRTKVGLQPLAEELEEDGLLWDLDEYKKNLPRIEKMYTDRCKRLKEIGK